MKNKLVGWDDGKLYFYDEDGKEYTFLFTLLNNRKANLTELKFLIFLPLLYNNQKNLSRGKKAQSPNRKKDQRQS
jgi:hypothetical protein